MIGCHRRKQNTLVQQCLKFMQTAKAATKKKAKRCCQLQPEWLELSSNKCAMFGMTMQIFRTRMK